jgi:cell division protein FtsI (penicillin-binding protein 3)
VSEATPGEGTGGRGSRRSAKRPAGGPRRAAIGKAIRRPAAASAPSEPDPSAPAKRARVRRKRAFRLASGPFRLWSGFCAVAFVLSLFAARLVQLQGVDEDDYAALAVAKGQQTIVLEAPRAPIYDRNGVKLAETVDAAKLVADPTYTARHAPQIAAVLHRRIGIDYLDAVAMLRTPHTRYVVVARHLAPLRANAIVAYLNAHNLPGIYTEHDTLRVYPAGDVAAPILGFTGDDGGLDGIEASYNDVLKGVDGHATYQVVDGQILPLAGSSVSEPVEGTGVKLTLDEDLQFLAQRDLAQAVKSVRAKSGVAVVMDPHNGQVLALADYPTFNPNDFLESPQNLYTPGSLTHVYEPGSVEKLLTSSAAIDAGYLTPRTKVVVPPDILVDGTEINDDFEHGTLHLTLAGVIAKSSNLGMVRAASRMPNDVLYRYLHKFGIGEPTDVGVAGPNSGVLSGPKSWIPVTRDDIDFGQGVSVTALQMAAAVSTIANGGEYVAPSLVEGTVSSSGQFTPAPAPARHRVISARTAHEVTRMMEDVVGPEGTAPKAAIAGYPVAGKTGTAQVALPGVGYHSGVFTVSFAGFAPADNPRFMIYVVIKDTSDPAAFGGVTAAPVFRNLMVSALQKYGVPPPPGKPQPLLPVYW